MPLLVQLWPRRVSRPTAASASASPPFASDGRLAAPGASRRATCRDLLPLVAAVPLLLAPPCASRLPAQDAASSATSARDLPRGPMTAHYEVTATTVAADAAGEIPLRVQLEVRYPPPGRMVVAVPVWTPGSYRRRDFPERIHDLTASGKDGVSLAVARLSPHAWEVPTGDLAAVTLSYRVALSPNDRFMVPGDQRRAITYEGPQVYLFVRDHTAIPCHVRFRVPEGWQHASALMALDDGSFFAADYDYLADCPVKLGTFQQFGFDAAGARIDVVVDGPGDIEFATQPWLANLRRIVECEAAIFGGLLPVHRYVFLYTASSRGLGGGLEHLACTAIGISTAQLRRSPTAGIGVTAHEFFHLWNVKRIRPRELGPFDYETENRTRALWLAEGVTSYYGEVAQARAGFTSEEAFWRSMARQISTLESKPARTYVSSEESSLAVWDARAPDRTLDYYNSGLVLGLALDLEVRRVTGNRRSLDDVMRALYRLCAERGRGFEAGEVATIAGAVAGVDLRPWFDRHVAGTVPPDYVGLLAAAGIDYREERRTQVVLRGLQPGGTDVWYVSPDAAVVGRLVADAGRVISVDGQAVSSVEEIEKVVAGKVAGDAVSVVLAPPRGGERTVRARVEARVRVVARLELRADASEQQLAIRRGIAGGAVVR